MNRLNELLTIRNLHTAFRIRDQYYNAVDNVSLTLRKNEVLAIVGESGCGKSTLASSIIGLNRTHTTRITGEILYNNKNLVELTEEQLNKIRGSEISMIFQDSLAALNPLMKIGDQIEEGLIHHTDLSKKERQKRVIELLQQVGIQKANLVAKQFPHELSGGMRQRVMIAMAISCHPNIIIADEPTTALDVTIQAQILDLLLELQRKTGAGIILITHDLGVVAEIANRVAVMYAGEIIEIASVEEIFSNPKHPYTKLLFQSIPQLSESERLFTIEGMVPSLIDLPRSGCRFASRIPWISQETHEQHPTLHEVTPNHFVRCTCWKHFHFKDKEGENYVEFHTN